jgi:high-affinity nickel-transport protein
MAARVRSTSAENNSEPEQSGLLGRLVGICSIPIFANVAGWAWALVEFAHQPVLIGTALLAYSLGLRHAIDADHIAAIDNVTRKLMQEGKRPVSVGFFFALGHSTVVVVASLAVALTANALSDHLVYYRGIGDILGTSASALFLFIVALANLIVLRALYRTLRLVERSDSVTEEDVDTLLRQRGWLARIFKPLFSFVSQSWHLYPVGLLFALGFDTASEVSLFGLSAQTSNAASSWSLLIFPTLFAAGMTLVDTADGVIMLGAYGWAYRNPMRKLLYNLTITSVSVLAALVIGGIETLGLISNQFHLQGVFWKVILDLNDKFDVLGYGIVGLFIVSWGGSFLVYRSNRHDRRAKPN